MEEFKSEDIGDFEELKIRWENFIAKIETLSPEICEITNNVFFNMVSDKRPKEDFVAMARETRPFLSKELWSLLEKFMDFMKNLPNPEGEHYRIIYEGMTPAGLIKRLLTKRPILFMNESDDHVLRSEPLKYIDDEPSKWDDLAKSLDKVKDDWPYLREYISYDEMLLSACVSMSTPTFFVSDGSLRNQTEKPSRPFISSGILCGLVGARLEKKGFMEHRFVFAKDEKNSKTDEVHKSDSFWIKEVFPEAFPEQKIPTNEEIAKKPEIYGEIYVNGVNIVYFKKRLAFSVISFIEEAINRAREKKRIAVASVPGIGAGVWRGSLNSEIIVNLIIAGVLDFLDNDFNEENVNFLAAIFLPRTQLEVYENYKFQNKISSIKTSKNDSVIVITFKNSKLLTIFNQSRYVAQLLPEKFKTCLVVTGYAWDGNSYPGNEYWIGSFSSFDPQAILCSCLGQFQNPEVNVKLADAERIKFY